MVRKASKIKAIAITGSSGKTSLKELLSQCLNKIASTSYSKKSFNNKFGVPISLFNIQKNNIFGVFEVGMDKKGEINHLTKLIMPDLGVITNISYAHIKNFKNLYEIALAKSEMINNIVSGGSRSEEHTSELQSQAYLVCRLLLEKKNTKKKKNVSNIQGYIVSLKQNL